MGSRVTVILKDGKTLSAERIQPSGMAGDPNRKGVIGEKLIAEGEVILGRERCERLWKAVTGLPATPPSAITALAAKKGEGAGP